MMTDNRPIAVGDYVRWHFPTYNTWVEGEIVKIDPSECSIRSDATRTNLPASIPQEGVYRVGTTAPSTLRRIPCPGSRPPGPHETCSEIRGEGCHPRPASSTQPVPELVDGLSREECLARYATGQNEVVMGSATRRATDRAPSMLSPAQLTAAREEWAIALRAKIAASAEARRSLVRVDLEIEPWE